jgi:D-alanyl-D-alanine carboxypeptidase
MVNGRAVVRDQHPGPRIRPEIPISAPVIMRLPSFIQVAGGLLALGLLLAATTPWEGPAAPQSAAVERSTSMALRAAVQGYIDALLDEGEFPGVSVGLMLAGGDTLLAVAGVADHASGDSLTGDSRFLAGSVGKTFFSAVILQLVNEGLVELDHPVARYLGDEPWYDRLPNSEEMTVRMLLNHTSGLVRYEFHPEVAERVSEDPDLVWTPEERLAYLFDTEAAFEAGEGWEYSDTNYIVLGMIIELLADSEAYDQIDRRFIGPLGLENTVPSDQRRIPGLVQGYAGSDNPFGRRTLMVKDGAMIFNPQLEWAGGGYASTPGDLAIWARALFSGAHIERELVRELVDGVPTPNPEITYGLGAMVYDTDLGPAYGHGGFFPGYLSEMRFYHAFDTSVAVQFNTSVVASVGRSPGEVAHELARLASEFTLEP